MTAHATNTHPPIDVCTLYERHAGVVWRRVRSFYRQEEAEEVVQEVFLRVTEQAHTYRGESSPVTWLYQVTTRHCLNRVRDARRRRELLDTYGQPEWSAPVSAPDQEALQFLRQFAEELDSEMLAVAVLYFRDGLSHDAIATLLGCSRRTVGNRLKALTELAQSAATPIPQALSEAT
jgi:RNA polymerase sigma-70 factor (ECF subfamily)